MPATRRVSNVKKESGAEKRKRLEAFKSSRNIAYRFILPTLFVILLVLAIGLYWRYGRGGALPSDPRALLRRAMKEAAKNMKSMGEKAAAVKTVAEAAEEAAVVVEN